MNEYTIGYLAVGSMFGLSIASLLYMIGGRNRKWVRRYVGSFVIAITVIVVSLLRNNFNPLFLILYPLKVGEFSQGYGGNWHIPKAVQRLLITLTSCVGGLLLCCGLGGGNLYWLLLLQLIVGGSTMMFAFKNPILAAAEEVLVCFLNNIVFMLYPFMV